jgi:hypothetical protein
MVFDSRKRRNQGLPEREMIQVRQSESVMGACPNGRSWFATQSMSSEYLRDWKGSVSAIRQ